MKIYLKNQENNLLNHLAYLCQRPVMDYDIKKLREKTSHTVLEDGVDINAINLDWLWNYQIFPQHIMTALPQWVKEGRAMRAGDTIVQQVFIPPFPAVSQKIIFGVRIKEIIDSPIRKGFSYETLEGHVECGISTFTVEAASDKIMFVIHTYSEPAVWISKILAPVFSLPYQAYCTRQALKNAKAQSIL